LVSLEELKEYLKQLIGLESVALGFLPFSRFPMASDSPQTALLDNYQAVVSAFCEFLTVAVHTILYERDIYPRTSFLSARKYNYPVKQSRHPKVCQWIEDAIAAVEAELLKVCDFPRGSTRFWVPFRCFVDTESLSWFFESLSTRLREKLLISDIFWFRSFLG
jgi:hypothetical protein